MSRTLWALFVGAVGGLACGAGVARSPAFVTVPKPEPTGSFPAQPAVLTPAYGSVLVVYRTTDGEEHTILCGGEVSLTQTSP